MRDMNGTGKVVATLVSLAALGGFVFGAFHTFAEPIEQRQDIFEANYYRELTDSKAVDNRSVEDRAAIHAELAAIEKSFAEIETQFRGEKAARDELEKRMLLQIECLEKTLKASHP